MNKQISVISGLCRVWSAANVTAANVRVNYMNVVSVSTERLGQCRVRYIVPPKSLEEIDGQMERPQILHLRYLFWTLDLCRDWWSSSVRIDSGPSSNLLSDRRDSVEIDPSMNNQWKKDGKDTPTSSSSHHTVEPLIRHTSQEAYTLIRHRVGLPPNLGFTPKLTSHNA